MFQGKSSFSTNHSLLCVKDNTAEGRISRKRSCFQLDSLKQLGVDCGEKRRVGGWAAANRILSYAATFCIPSVSRTSSSPSRTRPLVLPRTPPAGKNSSEFAPCVPECCAELVFKQNLCRALSFSLALCVVRTPSGRSEYVRAH